MGFVSCGEVGSVALLIAVCCADLPVLAVPPADDAASRIAASFRCPEDLESEKANDASYREFFESYRRDFPEKTVDDMLTFRYRLLVSHGCTRTLAFILGHITPDTKMLRLGNRDLGPKAEEFDPHTKVWTVRFTRDGLPASQSDENLLLNFYGWNPPVRPEEIANAFVAPRKDLHILGKFAAPDRITKTRAYFIVSETLYPGEEYGYLNLTKITSVGSSAYTVTFTKVITGKTRKKITENGKAWYLSEEGTTFWEGVSRVSVDESWEQHFAERK